MDFVFFTHTHARTRSLSLSFCDTNTCSAVTFEKLWPEVASDVWSCSCRETRRGQHTETDCLPPSAEVAVCRCACVWTGMSEYIGQLMYVPHVCAYTACLGVFVNVYCACELVSAAVCVCAANVNMSFTPVLTWKDSACPYLALIFGSRMVARLVPLTVSRVPPL